MRLIDADALMVKVAHRNVLDVIPKADFDRIWIYSICQNDMFNTVKAAPTIDAVPVPVVHGQWVKAHGMMPPEYHHRKQCSMCGGWALQDYFGRERLSHYCPNCGAKMDGGATGE